MNPFAAELLAVCRSFGVFEREAVCCGTVSLSQCAVLQELHEGRRDISSLTAHVGTSQSAMTRLVDGLERRGWVARVRSDDDRRRVDVELTPDGRGVASRLRELTQRTVDAILERIPREKHAQILETMRLVRSAMTDVRCGPGVCS